MSPSPDRRRASHYTVRSALRPGARPVNASDDRPSIFRDFYDWYFVGRIGRLRFLISVLIFSATPFALMDLLLRAGSAGPEEAPSNFFLFLLFTVGVLICMSFVLWFTAFVQRLHDVGRSGWWIICLWIPLLNLWLWFQLLLVPGQSATNAFGPEPDWP